MSDSPLRFVPYTHAHREACLAIFDRNCPRYFAPNEREDYERFLAAEPDRYRVCVRGDEVIGAFGLLATAAPGRKRLNWILIDPGQQKRGVGGAMMGAVLAEAGAFGEVTAIDIAASHVSAPFFARFGARQLRRTEHGWGPGMHRVDMELPIEG
jgi:GNAT superfamily N-acetyltransferase